MPTLQGPPGTGKTKTILALLSLILYAKHSGQTSGHDGPAAQLSVTRAPSQPELQRLWKAASPWITGQNPRWVELHVCRLVVHHSRWHTFCMLGAVWWEGGAASRSL